MSIRKIIKDNNKLLREKSEEVIEINEDINNLINDMEDTLQNSGGVGIAAIQIGVKKRVILIKVNGKRHLVINPKIINCIGEQEDYEGCLSVEKDECALILGKVKRPFIIEVEGLDENGKKIDIISEGLTARAFAHEIDHLDGILYTDKMQGEFKELKTEEERKQWKENREKANKGKVLIGMSGGVDSSVSAILLKEMGYEVIGATMELCPNALKLSTSAIEDSKKVCQILGIEHVVIDATKEFKDKVIDNFIYSYENCKTPNPCVECNRYLKFGVFFQKAMELKCDYVSTGHYAKVEYSEEYKQYVMKKSEADKKDQTYFLYSIPKTLLEKMIFPLENFTDKSDIRKIAEEHNLNVATKKDSQEICFIEDNDYVNFLNKNSNKKQTKGNIVLKDGTILGKHEGLINYTIGQRKGLGVSYKNPLYVIGLDKEKNEVIVGEEKDLYRKELEATDCNFLLDIDFSKEIDVLAKVRYRAKEAKAKLIYKEDVAHVIFEEPQRAITPGQSVVFYIGDILLGGGKIK